MKIYNVVKKYGAPAVASALVSTSALADYTSLTAAADWDAAATAVIAVAAAIAVALVALTGARLVLRMFGR